MVRMNAMHNCANPYQGTYPRILCLCSAGLLRSPTVAWVLGNRGCNTRAAGIHDYALIPVDEVLVTWAHQIVCVSPEIAGVFKTKFPAHQGKVVILDIPDIYPYREPKLIDEINKQLNESTLFSV